MLQTPGEFNRDFREGAVQDAAGRLFLGHPVAPDPLVDPQDRNDPSDRVADLQRQSARARRHRALGMVRRIAFQLPHGVAASGSLPPSSPAVQAKPCEWPAAGLRSRLRTRAHHHGDRSAECLQTTIRLTTVSPVPGD